MSELSRTRKSAGITLAAVARQVGLATGTVSAVLNNSASARSIPERTKSRIRAAVQELGYRPNFFAQSLRGRRSRTIGVMVDEIGDSYGTGIIRGIEQYLRARDFLFLPMAHRHDPAFGETGTHLLMDRGVDGFILVDMPLRQAPAIPSVAVAAHGDCHGVPNVVLDHHQAARIGLAHLLDLGHEDIAVMRGPTSNPESEERWKAICTASIELGVRLAPERIVQIDSVDNRPGADCPAIGRFLDTGISFTALFAYDDTFAIGAIRALGERGIDVPSQISVLGFDDMEGVAYSVPSLTTVRQPLGRMGATAAQMLLERIESQSDGAGEIAIQPELVVRESTQTRELCSASSCAA
jgi:LacI family transcriptional regulator